VDKKYHMIMMQLLFSMMKKNWYLLFRFAAVAFVAFVAVFDSPTLLLKLMAFFYLSMTLTMT